MAKQENFTADRVDNLHCKEGKKLSFYWDGKVPGLGLRATAAGARSYIFETRLHGKTLRLTIGDTKTWTVGKAQKEATRLKAMTDQGIDPRQVRADLAAADDAKRNEAMRRELTLGAVWPLYTAARKHTWGARHAFDHDEIVRRAGGAKIRGKGLTIDGPLVGLLDTKVSCLTAERIAKWLDKETKTRPTSTALAFRLLRGCLNWCETESDLAGLVPAGAMKAPKVRDALPAKNVKDDCLQREQLSAWFTAVRKIGNPVIAAFLQGLLLTGARRSELAELEWEDVNFQWNSLTIRDKVEGQRIIPLTPYVASLLAELKRRNDTPPPRHRILNGKTIANDLENWRPSQWVFSSTLSKSGRLMEPAPAHHQACTVAGIEGMTLHGLRRSFGTLSEWCEVPVGVVAQVMGHKPSAVAEKHYRRRPLDLLRSWHVKIEAWILEQAGIAQPSAEQAPGLRVVKAI